MRDEELERASWLVEACAKHLLNPEAARWLRGETREELLADAEALSVELRKSVPRYRAL